MKRLTKDDIRGCFPPVVTPFSEDEGIDFEAFRRELRYHLDQGVSGFLVAGATGEGYALTPDEVASLYRAAVEEVAGRVPILGGIIATSTRDAVKRAQHAREAGCDGVLATPVIYFSPGNDGMIDYYAAIWNEVGLPIVAYNSIPRSPLTPALVERLVEIPGIIAVKQGAGGTLDELGEMIDAVGDRIAITWSQDYMLFAGYAMGAVGTLGGMDATLPGHVIRLREAVERGDLATARQLHHTISAVARAVGATDFPAGIKAAINMQGRPVGRARRPYLPVVAEQESRIRRALWAAGVLEAVTA